MDADDVLPKGSVARGIWYIPRLWCMEAAELGYINLNK